MKGKKGKGKGKGKKKEKEKERGKEKENGMMRRMRRTGRIENGLVKL